MVSGGAETLPVVGEDAFVDHNDEEGTHTVKPSGKQLHKHCQRFVRHPRQVLIPLRASALPLPSLPELTHRYTRPTARTQEVHADVAQLPPLTVASSLADKYLYRRKQKS